MQWKSVQKSLRVASEPPFQTRLADLDVMQQLFWSRTSWHNRWQYKPQQNPILVTIICHRILTTSLRLLALKMTRNQIYGNVKLYHPFNDLRYLQNWNKADSLKYTPPPLKNLRFVTEHCIGVTGDTLLSRCMNTRRFNISQHFVTATGTTL